MSYAAYASNEDSLRDLARPSLSAKTVVWEMETGRCRRLQIRSAVAAV